MIGRDEILIFPVFPDKTGDVGAKRDDPQILFAREIQCCPDQLRGQSMAFQSRRNFGVEKSNAIKGSPVGEKSEKAANLRFETLSRLVIGYIDRIKVWFQLSPHGLRDFFIANVAKRAGWALLHL